MIRAALSPLVCCMLVVAAAADAAAAATVQVRSPGGGSYVLYVAGAGERNDLSFEPIEDSWPTAFLVRDPGARIAGGPGCVAVDAHAAACVSPSGSMYHLRARLGDGDDVLRPAGFNLVRADGGPGDDRLLGGTWDDRLNGGGGRDELRGGEGADVLTDGDRDDAGDPGRPGPDILDGGSGDDRVSYGQRTEAVRVDLADDRADGAVGEGDVVLGIESVTGGAGDDRLAGTRAANLLAGGGGRNQLIGRAGDDVLDRPSTATVACGRGRDSVIRPRVSTFIPRSCEGVFFPLPSDVFSDDTHVGLVPYPVLRRRQLGYEITCPTLDGYPVTCSAAIEIRERSRRRLLARGTLTPSGDLFFGGFLRLTLTPLGARLADAGRHPPATAALRGGSLPTARWTIRF